RRLGVEIRDRDRNRLRIALVENDPRNFGIGRRNQCRGRDEQGGEKSGHAHHDLSLSSRMPSSTESAGRTKWAISLTLNVVPRHRWPVTLPRELPVCQLPADRATHLRGLPFPSLPLINRHSWLFRGRGFL